MRMFVWTAPGRSTINTGDPLQSLSLGVGPFGYADGANASNPRKVKITDMTDGTSNTLLMSEVIMAANDTDFDIRGDFLNDDRPCTQFMTINTPNSGTDVSPYCSATAYPSNPPCTTTGARSWLAAGAAAPAMAR